MDATAPMLSGRDIICLSSIDWDFIWQGHQEIMSAFAAHGNRVLFVENTGVRAPTLRDLPRLKRRLLTWLRSTKGFRLERENLFVYSPVILPFPYSSIARRINRRLLLRALQRWMRATGFHQPILWTFLPTPLTLDLMQELDPDLSVYYCIDDLASSSPSARRISRTEPELFRRADLVFVTSEKLRQRAARFNRRVHLFPFGVSFERFERIRQAADAVPEDLARLPRPVAGYVGGLHQWVDQGLLAAVAERLPQVHFVLVGPVQTDVSRLGRCANVHLLGGRAHEDVPRYIKGFDVGIVPYESSEYTDHVYPTKLNEYLAMGIPVVATDLPEIRRFNREHGQVVAVADSADAFARAIRTALADRAEDAVTRRIETARQNSWSARIAQMSALIERELATRQARPDRWQELLQRWYRRTRSRVLATLIWLSVGYIVVFRSPLVWMAAEPLRLSAAPRPADAIVVFAGGVGESGKAGGGYQERVKQAVELYREGLAPRVIFSSGYTFVFQEAEIMKELAVGHGVPASAIILEQQAANTHENVRLVSAILDQHEWRSVLLVSSPYHMRRALLTWRKVAPHIQVVPTPVLDGRFYNHETGASLAQVRGILHEYLSLLYYLIRGWI